MLRIPLTVDFGQSLQETFGLGGYDNANDFDMVQFGEFCDHEVSGVQQIELVLVHFGYRIHTEEVLQRWEKEKIRPATLFELFTLGVMRPELQKEFPIVALRVVGWDPYERCRAAAMLFSRANKRLFDTPSFLSEWEEECRFAVVCDRGLLGGRV